jgi:Domain of unknown function (DUF6378)
MRPPLLGGLRVLSEGDYEILNEMMDKFEAAGINVAPIKSEEPLRAAILDEAKQAVCSDRNADYGEPIDNFGRWAGVCNALGYRGPDGRELKPHDLAIIAAGGKLCRAMQTPGKRDHSVDTAGYGALIYELVTLEG